MAKKNSGPAHNDAESQAIREGLGYTDPQERTAALTSGAMSARDYRQSLKGAKKQVRPRVPLSDTSVPDAERKPSAKSVNRLNSTLKKQGIDISVPKLMNPTQMGGRLTDPTMSGTNEYPVTGSEDVFQRMINSSNDLSRKISEYKSQVDPGLHHHYDHLDGLLADADSHISDALSAHMQGHTVAPRAGTNGYVSNAPTIKGSRVGGSTNKMRTYEPSNPLGQGVTPNTAFGHLSMAAGLHADIESRLRDMTKQQAQAYPGSITSPYTGTKFGETANSAVKSYAAAAKSGKEAVSGQASDAILRNEAGYTPADTARKLAGYEAGRPASEQLQKLFPGARFSGGYTRPSVEHYVSGTDEAGKPIVRVRRAGEAGHLGRGQISPAQQQALEEAQKQPKIGEPATTTTQYEIRPVPESLPPLFETHWREVPKESAPEQQEPAPQRSLKGLLNPPSSGPTETKVPDISERAKNKFILGQRMKGVEAEEANRRWSAVEAYTNKKVADYKAEQSKPKAPEGDSEAWQSYANNIKVGKAHDELNSEDLATRTRAQNTLLGESARLQQKQHIEGLRAQRSAGMPARQQALDDLVRAVKGIHDQASTTNDKGTFVNPQARKAAGNAMKALDVHLGAANQDDAGEAERIMKIAGHATDAAHALAGRGSQNPLVLQTSHLGHVHELANAYISKWNATRNPTGITGAFANNEQLGRKNPKKPAGGASTAGLGTPAPFAPETPSQGKK